MRMAVFGLGYVGTVSAACFADQGHDVIAVDVDPVKVGMVQRGRSPVIERGVAELVRSGARSGRLEATTDETRAVLETDLALVCVGTPSGPAGSLSTDHLEKVMVDVGAALRLRDERYLVVVRSTIVPGTSEERLIPLLESTAGMRVGDGIGYCVNPEFLREGTSVADFRAPSKTVVGRPPGREDDGATVAALYDGLGAPCFELPLALAEMTKYAENAFHALKVAFGNEIGAFCHHLGVDGHTLMQLLATDTKLNISPAYLLPGMPFGGSCLPKDVRALVYEARHADVRLPLLENLLTSNDAHADRIYDEVTGTGAKRVSVYGLSFKAGTDDLRESPLVTLCERLLGRGIDLVIFDPEVSTACLRGANRQYIAERIPHLSRHLTDDPDRALHHGEVHVVGRPDPAVVRGLEAMPDACIIDLIHHATTQRLADRPGYVGVGW